MKFCSSLLLPLPSFILWKILIAKFVRDILLFLPHNFFLINCLIFRNVTFSWWLLKWRKKGKIQRSNPISNILKLSLEWPRKLFLTFKMFDFFEARQRFIFPKVNFKWQPFRDSREKIVFWTIQWIAATQNRHSIPILPIPIKEIFCFSKYRFEISPRMHYKIEDLKAIIFS